MRREEHVETGDERIIMTNVKSARLEAQQTSQENANSSRCGVCSYNASFKHFSPDRRHLAATLHTRVLW